MFLMESSFVINNDLYVPKSHFVLVFLYIAVLYSAGYSFIVTSVFIVWIQCILNGILMSFTVK